MEITPTTPQPNAADVRNFINANSTRACTITEFKPFWEACTPEEKQQFGNEARSLMAS